MTDSRNWFQILYISEMPAFSDYLKNKIREHLFKATAYTASSTVAIALFTADPTAAYTTAGEVANAGSYARQTLNPSAGSNWTKDGSDAGKVYNASDITFPTASASWGTITHVALTDSATYGGGNLLFYGSLTASKAIGTGDVFKFLAGDLAVTLS